MAKEFKTYDEAVEAQKVAAQELKAAKTELTEYYRKNKLKRSEDYTDDAKHGTKIARLEKTIDKRTETLADVNVQLEELKPKGTKKIPSVSAADREARKASKGKEKPEKPAKEKKERAFKYEYPEDCDTPAKKKKYRIEQRKLASGEGEKAPKTKAKAEKVDTPEKTTTKKGKAKAAKAKTEEPVTTKTKKKVVKKKARTEEDD